MFSSTLQFIIVLVATALLDIIQLGLYFDDDLGSSISKYIVFSLDDPLIQELVTYFANYRQATDYFLQFFFVQRSVSFSCYRSVLMRTIFSYRHVHILSYVYTLCRFP